MVFLPRKVFSVSVVRQ